MLCLEVMCRHGNTTENISNGQMPGGAQTNYIEFNTHIFLSAWVLRC